jgi:hypothetical protein
MIKNAITLLIAVGVLSAFASPVWALAECPLLRSHTQTHPCCPKSKPDPVPVSKCIEQCGITAVTTQSPPQLAKFTPVQVEMSVRAVIVPIQFHPQPVYFDSSGLFLRVCVLRI